MNHVKITTPSRLHFSLLDLNGALGRIDGGFGLAITEPNFQIIAEIATDIDVAASVYRERAINVLQRLQQSHPFPGIKLTFESEIPMHCGFGSGTQLAPRHRTGCQCVVSIRVGCARTRTGGRARWDLRHWDCSV